MHAPSNRRSTAGRRSSYSYGTEINDMALNYENLDARTRSSMLAEVESDISQVRLYMSNRLNGQGTGAYVTLLKDAVQSHDDAWLASQKRTRSLMKEAEERNNPKSGA